MYVVYAVGNNTRHITLHDFCSEILFDIKNAHIPHVEKFGGEKLVNRKLFANVLHVNYFYNQL